MTTEEYIAALDNVKTMLRKTSEAYGWILGKIKGAYFKAKKMPQQQLR